MLFIFIFISVCSLIDASQQVFANNPQYKPFPKNIAFNFTTHNDGAHGCHGVVGRSFWGFSPTFQKFRLDCNYAKDPSMDCKIFFLFKK